MSDQKKITVYVSMGLVGCKQTETIEIDADCSDKEIKEIAQEIMFNMIDWGWYEGEEKKSRR